MDSTDVQESSLTNVFEAQNWALRCIEEGSLVEGIHSDSFNGSEKFSELIVSTSDSENVMVHRA